jgi:hypothetical protein
MRTMIIPERSNDIDRRWVVSRMSFDDTPLL